MDALNNLWTWLITPRTHRGQMGGIVGRVIAIVIGLIMVLEVLVPFTQSAVTGANVTGISLTVLNMIVPLEIIGALLMAVGLLYTSYTSR